MERHRAEKSSSKRSTIGDASSKEKAKTHKLSLKGSSKQVAEFFEYSINTILYQRGVYPVEDFHAVKKYGLNMLVTSDDQVKAYIKKIMSQLNKWMLDQKISKLVIVFTGKESGEHLERWEFNVQLTHSPKSKSRSHRSAADQENSSTSTSTSQHQQQQHGTGTAPPPPPSDEEIQSSIRALFRQITACVTFLPELNEPCTFNVLVYADADSDVPIEWGDSDAKEIADGEKVQLRSFSTASHRVDTLVSYRLGG